MLQEQFYYRLLLIIGVGIIYVKAMMKMAQYKPVAEVRSKNIVMKVIGGFFILLAIFEAALGVYLTTQVQHPTQMIDFVPNPNQIVRPSSSHVVWGYVTSAQWQIVSQISNAMTSLGWGAYFLFYRKSNSTWWKKILKFLFAVLLCIFFYSATDFHYFDYWEWLPIVLFGIMTYIVDLRVKKSLKEKVVTPKEVLDGLSFEETQETVQTNSSEDDSRFMPPMPADEVAKPEVPKAERPEKEQPVVAEASGYKYCRYCGNKIDYEGVKFCKHCGKPIN